MSRRNMIQVILVFASAVMWCAAAHAQLEVQGPLHLAHLRGVVVNSVGKPIANADVTLVRDERVRYETKTDAAGRFAFKHVSGRYMLRVKSEGNAGFEREVIVGEEVLTYLHSNMLYIVAGPSACADDCSSVFTSRGDFDKAIRRNTGHAY